jgi:hypothetical protein
VAPIALHVSVGVELTPGVPLVGLGDAGVPGSPDAEAIVAVVLAEALAAKSSVTVNVIVKVPAAAYACEAVADAEDVLAVPSPQFHT